MHSPYVAINIGSEDGIARGEGQMEPSEPSPWSKQTKHGSECEMACDLSYLFRLLLLSAADRLR